MMLMMMMDLREVGYGGKDWIDLHQGRNQWPAIVNTIMNLRIHTILGNP
jgi:hypothetical protein